MRIELQRSYWRGWKFSPSLYRIGRQTVKLKRSKYCEKKMTQLASNRKHRLHRFRNRRKMAYLLVLLHSSLLSVFGLNAASTYDSYLPLIFGKFALIWGHFQNVSVCRFRGCWGRRGQTTSKSKTTKILNENLLKLDEIQNLASATLKMTSWPQWPRNGLSNFTFFKSGDQAEKNEL